MAQQGFAGLALLIALGFAIMALHGCASSEQSAAARAEPISIASMDNAPAVPEFHGAAIGDDGIRSRLTSEN